MAAVSVSIPGESRMENLSMWGVEGPGELSRDGHRDDATGMMLSGRILTQGPGGGQDILYGEGKYPSGHIHDH